MFRFFIPLIILGFGATLFFQYIQPTRAEITRLNNDIVELDKAKEDTKQNIDAKIAELKDKRSKITKSDISKLDRMVPKREDFDLPAFINDMQNVALANKYPFKNLSVSGDPKSNSSADSYQEVTVSFSIECTYDQFKEFIKGIETSQQLFDITSVSFTAPGEKGTSVYTVSFVTYFR